MRSTELSLGTIATQYKGRMLVPQTSARISARPCKNSARDNTSFDARGPCPVCTCYWLPPFERGRSGVTFTDGHLCLASRRRESEGAEDVSNDDDDDLPPLEDVDVSGMGKEKENFLPTNVAEMASMSLGGDMIKQDMSSPAPSSSFEPSPGVVLGGDYDDYGVDADGCTDMDSLD